MDRWPEAWRRLADKRQSSGTGQRFWAGAVRLLLWAGFASVHAVGAPAATVSLTTFRAQVVDLQRIVASCSVAASACAADSVPDDEEVLAAEDQAAFDVAFHMSWQWLR